LNDDLQAWQRLHDFPLVSGRSGTRHPDAKVLRSYSLGLILNFELSIFNKFRIQNSNSKIAFLRCDVGVAGS
jgi:hypothetical protein